MISFRQIGRQGPQFSQGGETVPGYLSKAELEKIREQTQNIE